MLQISDISKSFNGKRALDQVSFNVHKGSILGLLGPNGAGKTTLLRILNKIILPDEGAVKWNDQLLREADLGRIGYLPEERGLYRTMTVAEHAYFFGQLKDQSKSDITQELDYWLKRFDILNWKNKRIEELSKGMAQKVQFICTVIHRPELLILDEPFSGFDPVNVELIGSEIKQMKDKGTTIIFSSHNMKNVEEICDEVAMVNQSKLVLNGSVQKIREERKQGLYAVQFKGNMIAFATALWAGYEIVHSHSITNELHEVHVRMRQENDFEDLLKTLMGSVKIVAAWEVSPSMHDIFIELTNESKAEVK